MFFSQIQLNNFISFFDLRVRVMSNDRQINDGNSYICLWHSYQSTLMIFNLVKFRTLGKMVRSQHHFLYYNFKHLEHTGKWVIFLEFRYCCRKNETAMIHFLFILFSILFTGKDVLTYFYFSNIYLL